MASSFSFGVKNCWNETSLMQSQGLYWINTDIENAAYELCAQVLEAQDEGSKSSVIFQQDNFITRLDDALSQEHVLFTRLMPPHYNIKYYQMDSSIKALKGLPVDIRRLGRVKNQLIIFMLPAESGIALKSQALTTWLQQLAALCARRHCAILIICYGKGIHSLMPQLYIANRILYGLAALNSVISPAKYVISWWHNQFGVEANRSFALQPRFPGWQILMHPSEVVSAINDGDDQWMYLAERSILEGAPPLSDKWFIFADNQHLLERGLHARAATLIFALLGNDRIEQLARQIHLLRMRRGNTLKIVVREMYPALRYIDQRLLQACGANLVVPHAARLSSFLTLLDDIQQGIFTRYVPEDIELLLQGRLTTHHKGYLPLRVFCEVMQAILGQPTLAMETRGVLLALRPVGGINPSQAISLCQLRRDGDVITFSSNQVYLFLTNCQTSDVDNVLNFLVSLPPAEVFQSRTLWYQDNDIKAQIRLLSTLDMPATAFTPPPAHLFPAKAAAMPKKRIIPTPIDLRLDGAPDLEGHE